MRVNGSRKFYSSKTELPHHLVYRGIVLQDGFNATECEQLCGNVIEWERSDEDGPAAMQPQGFRCQHCDQFSCNDCGLREYRVCRSCIKLAFQHIA